MKKILFIAGIVVLLAGIIASIYGSNQSFIDTNNIIHDSAWMPIGALTILIGGFSTVAAGTLFGLTYLIKRKTNSTNK